MLEKSEIITQLRSSSVEEAGKDYEDSHLTDKAQTSVFGIQVPLIMINKTVIDFDCVRFFSLQSTHTLPELSLTIEDRFELINNIDKPYTDNEVRIQILPKFENAYKKINLTFYINSINVNGSLISISGTYKLPELTSSQFKTFGEIDTYSLFKKVAQDTKLGFATNITELSDNRYVYCNNKSLLDILNYEIEYSNSTEHILDWWIDYWDNINLADVKERYNTVDSDEELKIWVLGQVNEVTVNNTVEPTQVVAVINNHPSNTSSELFVSSYKNILSTGSSISEGTDVVYGVYEDNKSEYIDYLVQDGDIKHDIFLKYNYMGEAYGDYNYILANCLRRSYLKKMNLESIKVTMPTPVIALMRGHKVNFLRYENNDIVENKLKSLEEAGLIDRNVESNIPLSKYDITDDNYTANGNFKLDRTVSGQYLINGVEIIYSDNKWEYTLTMIKPASTRVSILNEE
jgi:hypothetical protein